MAMGLTPAGATSVYKLLTCNNNGNFENYRIRALLYAGKPNWRVLGSIVVR